MLIFEVKLLPVWLLVSMPLLFFIDRCSGVLLVVDAAQGIQAQTVHLYK
jgi:hypothetical protein